MNNILRKFTSKGEQGSMDQAIRSVEITFQRNYFSEISAKEYLKQVFHHEKIIFADLMVEFKNIERDLNERMSMADR